MAKFLSLVTLVLITILFSSAPAAANSRSHPKAQIVSHPAGCPSRAFCGCGVSLKVFGKRVRNLYLARNWLRFPRAKAAPGMVAARHGHVFYIIKTVSPGKVLAYDPNSGRHQTRIHVRRLAGFVVVNPHRTKLAQL